jgi:hypothetical protein
MAIGLSLACRTTAGEPRARYESCPEASADTAGWQPVAYAPFTTILPTAFHQDTTTLRCIHGGQFWVAARREFGYCWGTFDRVAPAGASGERVMVVAGRPAVVSCGLYRGRWFLTAIHLGDSSHFAIHGYSPDRVGLAPFMRALQSARPRPQ